MPGLRQLLVGLARGVGVGRRQRDLQQQVQVAGRLAGQAALLEPQLEAVARVARHRHLDHAAGRRRHLHLRAERGFGRRDRQRHVEVAPSTR